MSAIEFSLIEADVVNGLKTGNEALKALQNEMRLEDVEKLMQDTADAIAYQEEVSALIAGVLTTQDEEDVLEELAQYEKEAVSGAGVLAGVLYLHVLIVGVA